MNQQSQADRFKNVILPATVELVHAAIAGSVVNAENVPSVIASISEAVTRLVNEPGVFDKEMYHAIAVSSTALDLEAINVVTEKYSQPVRSQPIASQSTADVSQPILSVVGAEKLVPPAPTARVIPFAKPRQEALEPELRVDATKGARYGRRKTDHQTAVDNRGSTYLKAPVEPQRKLPKGITSINETVMKDHIICLEDGRKVKDLGKHLADKGISPEEYKAKWGLPNSYPLRSPKAILTRGTIREFNPALGTFQVVSG